MFDWQEERNIAPLPVSSVIWDRVWASSLSNNSDPQLVENGFRALISQQGDPTLVDFSSRFLSLVAPHGIDVERRLLVFRDRRFPPGTGGGFYIKEPFSNKTIDKNLENPYRLFFQVFGEMSNDEWSGFENGSIFNFDKPSIQSDSNLIDFRLIYTVGNGDYVVLGQDRTVGVFQHERGIVVPWLTSFSAFLDEWLNGIRTGRIALPY